MHAQFMMEDGAASEPYRVEGHQMDQSELIEPLWSMVILNNIVGGDTLVTRESGGCIIILDNGRKILMEHEATGCTRILVRVLPEAGCAKAYAAKSHTEVSHRLSQIFKRPAHILQHTIANTRGYSKDIKILEVPMGGRAEGGALRKPLRGTTVTLRGIWSQNPDLGYSLFVVVVEDNSRRLPPMPAYPWTPGPVPTHMYATCHSLGSLLMINIMSTNASDMLGACMMQACRAHYTHVVYIYLLPAIKII